MADPVSLVASVITIAGVAYKSCKTLSDLFTGIQQAPKDIAELNVDLSIIQQNLQSLQSTLNGIPDAELSNGLKECLQNLKPSMAACGNACDDFVGKFKMPVSRRGDGEITLLDKIRLHFKEKDTTFFKSSLSSHKQTLIVAYNLTILTLVKENRGDVQRLEKLTTIATGKISNQIEKLQAALESKPIDDQIYKECMKALVLTDPRNDRDHIRDTRGKNEPGTCQWILKQKEFTAWSNGDNHEILLLVGPPGIGKTMLSIFLVDELEKTPQTMAYFFCDNKDVKRRTVTAILRGLLLQLLDKPNSLFFKYIENKYKQKGASLFNDRYSLWRVFLDMLKDPHAGKVCLLIDGLDECDEASVKDFLSLLERDFKSMKAKFLITCRPGKTLERLIEPLSPYIKRLDIDSEKMSRDISIVIERGVDNLAKIQGYAPDLKEKVFEAIKAKADGTLLWVSLVLARLSEVGSERRNVLQQIRTLPRGLNEAYDRILSRIKHHEVDKAKFVLRWLAVARRPPTVDELDTAYALRPGKWTRDNLPKKREIDPDIYKCCEPLVYVSDNRVNLVHQSLKDYLLSDDRDSSFALLRVFALFPILWAGRSGGYIVSSILFTIGLFTTMPFEAFSSSSNFIVALQNFFNFNIYTSRYRVNLDETNFLVFKICWKYLFMEKIEKRNKIARSNSEEHCSIQYANEELPEHALAASSASIAEVVWSSHTLNELPDLRDRWLLAAARDGHKTVVRLLLENGAKVTARDNDRSTALHLAVRNRHEAVVKMLLEKKPDIFREEFGGLVEDGSLVKMLLAKEMKTDYHSARLQVSWLSRIEQFREDRLVAGVEWGFRWMLIFMVCFFYRYGFRMPKWALARRFLEWWLDIQLEEPQQGSTILIPLPFLVFLWSMLRYQSRFWWWSRFWGLWWWDRFRRGEFFAELFESIHSTLQWFSQLLLWEATGGGYGTFVRLLLMMGTKPDFWGFSGSTPLSQAVQNGHEGVVRQLLATGKVDIDSKDWNGRTPLTLATMKGYQAVVKQLLAQGAETESKDKYGSTPLSIAVTKGYEAIVKQLLAQGAETESKDKYGSTPLSIAATKGYEAIVKQLLAQGAEADSKDKNGNTPLGIAASKGHEAIVKELLAQVAKADSMDNSVDPNSKNNIKRTPLSLAARTGQVGVVMTLLADDRVDPSPKDYYGSTPLSIAVRNCHIEITNLLLDKDHASSNSPDSFGRTPLWYAIRYGNSDITQLLLNHAKRCGMSVCEDDLPIEVISKPFNTVSGYCDICTMSFQKDDTYYHCKVCNGGGFWVCLECYEIGRRCWEVDHEIIQKKAR